MAQQETLELALFQIDSTIKLVKGNQSEKSIVASLQSAKYEIERQLESLPSTPKEAPVAVPPKPRVNTGLYRIEELCTTGWELADHQHIRLNKERAQEVVNDMINNGTSTDRIRLVVDA